MSRLRVLSFSLFFALLLSVVTAVSINAQTPPQGFDATVSPVFFDLSGSEGSTLSENVRLRNNSASEISVTGEVKKMGADETGALTIKDQDDGTLSWVKIENPKITLKPKEWVNVPFTITVPKAAAFGYYWALSFTDVSGPNLNTTGAKLNASIVVPVLLNVPKAGAKTEGKIVSFTTDSVSYEYPPVTFKTIFANTGNIHFRPTGNIFIKDFLGRTVGTININANQGAVLPNVKRTFTTDWDDGFITYENKMQGGEIITGKDGKPQKEMKVHFDKLLDLRIGKYTATALVVVNGATRDYAYDATTNFFVFPWKIVLGTIIFIILAGVGLFSTIKSIARKIGNLFGRKNANT